MKSSSVYLSIWIPLLVNGKGVNRLNDGGTSSVLTFASFTQETPPVRRRWSSLKALGGFCVSAHYHDSSCREAGKV